MMNYLNKVMNYFFPSSNQGKLSFIPPSQQQFETLLRDSADYYANEMVRFGEFFDLPSSQVQSDREVYSCFPEGLNTLNHEIFMIYRGKNLVGYIWHEKENEKVYLMYMYVYENYRRQGIAKLAIDFYEQKARDLGASECILYVFKQNTPAIYLYKTMGYTVASEVKLNYATENSRYIMTKKL